MQRPREGSGQQLLLSGEPRAWCWVLLDVDRKGVVEVQVTGDLQNACLPKLSDLIRIQRLKGSLDEGFGKG